VALHWTSALTMGVPELDERHRELFERVDLLLDAMLKQDRSEAGRLLEFMRQYTKTHFSGEEQLMASLSYPSAALHAAEHRRFAAAMRELDEAYSSSGATAELVLKLEREVVGWLHDHVYSTDVALGRYVQSSRSRTPIPSA
jgi:hemerythrin